MTGMSRISRIFKIDTRDIEGYRGISRDIEGYRGMSRETELMIRRSAYEH